MIFPRGAGGFFSSLNDRTQESLTSIRMIKAFGLEDRQSAQFAADAADTGEEQRVARIDARFDPTIYIAIGAANLLAIGGGSWLVLQGRADPGSSNQFCHVSRPDDLANAGAGGMFNIVERGSRLWTYSFDAGRSAGGQRW